MRSHSRKYELTLYKGTIPTELGEISSLENFSLHSNRLSGTVSSHKRGNDNVMAESE
jgi:hypothetical protein